MKTFKAKVHHLPIAQPKSFLEKIRNEGIVSDS